MADSTVQATNDGAELYHEQLARVNNELAVLARENRRQAREQQELVRQLQTAIEERDSAYWQLRKVQEVLPLCIGCGRVDDGVDWTSVAQFLRERAPFVSHAYCPDCEDEVGGSVVEP